MVAPVLWWVRNTLRLADNPPLVAALELANAAGVGVIPVFVWPTNSSDLWPRGAASRWWLHHSLGAFQQSLQAKGSTLIVRSAPTSQEALLALVAETGATHVVTDERLEPAIVTETTAIQEALKQAGASLHVVPNANHLLDVSAIKNLQGKAYQVFTPFYKNALTLPRAEVLAAPSAIPAPSAWPMSESVDALGLLPTISWDTTMGTTWTPGEQGSPQVLNQFLTGGLSKYLDQRDLPALDIGEGVSGLSPYLHFGEISPRQIADAVRHKVANEGRALNRSEEGYLRQLVWREFAHHLLVHFPTTPTQPLRPEFSAYPWADESLPETQEQLKRWQQGQTGYPLVDAGMRQLWATGWMHNRLRMVVGSFLVKHLRIHWLRGAEWFWDTLVDADLPNNTLGWQWIAGCGADAAPYFRVFNPITQSKKFDAQGDYIRRWVPELAGVSAQWIHCPWEAPPLELLKAKVTLGKTYPYPIVDHTTARDCALEGYEAVKRESASLKASAG
ncbi:MAG: deoxyribodipyrimidine photo-lyase [Vampirovibrionales bacterium]|nr:deoxyribodipyrimidine photo-lyase [Vampirovibrionales bacterium]